MEYYEQHYVMYSVIYQITEEMKILRKTQTTEDESRRNVLLDSQQIKKQLF